MKNTLRAFVSQLNVTDYLFARFNEPLVVIGLFLLKKRVVKVLLDAYEFCVFFWDIVAEDVDGYFEIYEVYLSLHFPNIT